MATRKGMARKTARKAYFPKPRPRRTSPKMKRLQELVAKKSKSLSAARIELSGGFYHGAGIKPQAIASIAGGGALAGVASHYMPETFGFSTPLVGGAALIAGSMLLKNATAQGALGCIGSGMLAAWSHDAAASWLAKSCSEQPESMYCAN